MTCICIFSNQCTISILHAAGHMTSDAAVYELNGPDLEGKNKLFRKPWAMTANMFIGMSFCIPLAYLEERGKRKKRMAIDATGDGLAPLLNGAAKVPPFTCHVLNSNRSNALPWLVIHNCPFYSSIRTTLCTYQLLVSLM